MSTETTTIVLANRPRILRELLLHALTTAEGNFEVVEVSDDSQLPAVLERTTPDWAIVGAMPDEESVPATLASEHPGMAVMAVATDGSQVSIITHNGRGPVRTEYPDISLSQLMTLLQRGPQNFN